MNNLEFSTEFTIIQTESEIQIGIKMSLVPGAEPTRHKDAIRDCYARLLWDDGVLLLRINSIEPKWLEELRFYASEGNLTLMNVKQELQSSNERWINELLFNRTVD